MKFYKTYLIFLAFLIICLGFLNNFNIELFKNNEINNKLYPGFYINHPDAKDRKVKLEKHLKSFGLDKSFKQHLVNLKTEPKVTDSHKHILRKAIELNLQYVIILEDDVEFKEDPRTYIDNALTKLNGDWDVLLLGANLKNAKVEYKKELNLGKIKGGECYGCHSYMVNNRYFKTLLNNMRNENEGGACIETYYKNKHTPMLDLCKKDKWYFINPLLGIQNDEHSFHYNTVVNKSDGRFDFKF
jgi:hypothetical protein